MALQISRAAAIADSKPPLEPAMVGGVSAVNGRSTIITKFDECPDAHKNMSKQRKKGQHRSGVVAN